MDGSDASLPEHAAVGAGRRGAEPAAEEGEEVEGAVDRHPQRDRCGHHAADVEGGACPAEEPEHEDRGEHVGDHRDEPSHHVALHGDHHQRDHHEGGDKTREQVGEERFLDGVDEWHGAGVIGDHAAIRAAMGGDDGVDPGADHAEEVPEVDARERRGPGRHPPQLLALDIPHDPHVVEARETLLELPGGDRSGRLAAEPGADVEIGEERGR